MTAEIIQIKAHRGPRVRKAYEAYLAADAAWGEAVMILAIEMKSARDECGENDRAFGMWLAENDCSMNRDDSAAFVGIGTDLALSRRILQETKSRSVRLIWLNEIKPLICRNAATDRQEIESIAEPQPEAITEEKVENPKPSEETEAQKSSRERFRKSESKLYRIGDGAANLLLAKFKHPKMLSHFLGGDDSQTKKRSRMLRYLATRIAADYPQDCLDSNSWSTRLLYPHLPQKMLDMFAKNVNMIDMNHPKLAETEALFMKTPECGVSDPPLVAFNKAYSIYQAVSAAKNNGGIATDVSAVVHRPTFADDEGKRPVIIRGMKLWPRDSGETYCYDDLRCACGMATSILTAFDEPRESSMATKSLKLRHVSAWLPPRGINAIGASLEGVMRAWTLVVYAYSANQSDVMESPEASLRKQGE